MHGNFAIIITCFYIWRFGKRYGWLTAYSPKTDEKDIRVEKTSKGNWKVFDANGKRICLVSKSILNDEVVADYNVTKCNCED